MGVATGCSCKEVYRFPHTTYPYSSCICRGGSRIDSRGGLSIPRALARAKFYVLRPLLTSFPHSTSYTKKK